MTPEPGQRIECRAKDGRGGIVQGKVLAVYDEPVVIVEQPDGGSYLVIPRDDHEWRLSRDD